MHFILELTLWAPLAFTFLIIVAHIITGVFDRMKTF